MRKHRIVVRDTKKTKMYEAEDETRKRAPKIYIGVSKMFEEKAM